MKRSRDDEEKETWVLSFCSKFKNHPFKVESELEFQAIRANQKWWKRQSVWGKSSFLTLITLKTSSWTGVSVCFSAAANWPQTAADPSYHLVFRRHCCCCPLRSDSPENQPVMSGNPLFLLYLSCKNQSRPPPPDVSCRILPGWLLLTFNLKN